MPGVDVEAEDMKCEATALFYAAMAANEKAVGRGGGQKNKKQKKKPSANHRWSLLLEKVAESRVRFQICVAVWG